MVRILLLAAIISYVCSKVYVYSPKELITKVEVSNGDNNGFEISLANFGIIPYGHSLIGKLYFDPDNPTGCEKFENFGFTEEDTKDNQTPIILVHRGNCTFVKKVRNIEHAGGRLGIVIEKKDGSVTDTIMSDDGTGMSINIPSFMISKSDGKLLLDYITDNGKLIPEKKDKEKKNDNTKPKEESEPKKKPKSEDEEEEESDTKNKKKKPSSNDEENSESKPIEVKFKDVMKSASLYVNFELPNPDQRVEYDIWYSSIDNRALDFISDFQKYDDKFAELVLMTPHFVTWKCNNCEDAIKQKE